MGNKNDPILNAQMLAQRIRKGSACVIPTDTLPALAALPDNASKLWEIKQRTFEKPLILMGANFEDLVHDVVSSALDDAVLVAEKYWPGPLTMVLPASGKIVSALNKKDSTIGLRVPSCELILDLFKITGPLATTSANISGSKPSLDALETVKIFPQTPVLGPLPWPISSGVASTVIAWQSKGKWKLLRQGSINPAVTFVK